MLSSNALHNARYTGASCAGHTGPTPDPAAFQPATAPGCRARQTMERILAVTDWPAISKNDDLFQRSQAQRWRAIYEAAFDWCRRTGKRGSGKIFVAGDHLDAAIGLPA